MTQNLLFQYCQKIVVFRNDDTEVLLCKRKWEADYDGVFSFIGGKMEVTDESILAWVQREKNEEVGKDVKLSILKEFHSVTFFRKKDGNSMILPHYYANYLWWEILINDEYSEYRWVRIEDLEGFEPKVETVPDMVKKLLHLKKSLGESIEYVQI